MPEQQPKYKIGDFVRCHYDFFEFYSCFYGDDYPYLPHYGIIVDIASDIDWITMEAVYGVYCMDGESRYFLEDEISIP